MVRYAMRYVFPGDTNVLTEYENLGRVPCDVAVSYKTELLFALLSARVK